MDVAYPSQLHCSSLVNGSIYHDMQKDLPCDLLGEHGSLGIRAFCLSCDEIPHLSPTDF